MPKLLDEVLALISETVSFSEGMRVRLLEVVQTLSNEKLQKLKTLLLKIQAEDVEKMTEDLAALKSAGAAFAGWKAQKARDALKRAEAVVSREDIAAADALIARL